MNKRFYMKHLFDQTLKVGVFKRDNIFFNFSACVSLVAKLCKPNAQ